MKKLISTTLVLAMFSLLAFSQTHTQFTQTVRGTILDIDSKLPLPGAVVIILGTNPLLGTATAIDGTFRFEKIPIGRIAIQISFIGYESKTITDIVVISGNEMILDLTMQESVVKMDDVIVHSNKITGKAINDMAMLSARSISPEETKRFAGTWDDPSHIMSSFAGIATSQNANNDIIVRGNAPKYVQWRLEGVEITSPYHQADQNSSVAGFSALNNKLLSTSDFYTGAFSPEYGDVLSGVYDVKLRAGNNEKFEASVGVGIMGTDFTVEGPFKKGYAGSYILNYRFFAIGAIQKGLGVYDLPGGVSTTFQNTTFKVLLPSKKMGTFSFFGLAGKDELKVLDVQPEVFNTPGNGQLMPDITQDYYKDNYLGNFGMNHTLTLNSYSYIKTTLAYSATGMNDDVFDSKIITTDEIIDTVDRTLSSRIRIKTSAYKGSITYNIKINAKNKIQLGTSYSLINEINNQTQLNNDATTYSMPLDFNGNITTMKNFIGWKHNFNDNISLVSGLHNMNVLFNNKSTLEPRIALNWKINDANSIYAGYGKHSNMERVHNYYTKVEQPDGSITEPNKDLDLLKADHYIMGYDRKLTQNTKAKVELYYQHLYNLPVENDNTSYYATLNEGSDFRYVNLVNKGTGKNYGAEITIERFFNNHYYFLINGSLFDSKYKSLEGVERNTKYNSNTLFNLLCGKEFDKLGKRQNKTLSLNAKAYFNGGQRYIPMLRDANGNLAVDPAKNQFWDYEKAYDKKLDALYSINFTISYKINGSKATQEIYFELQNITNHLGRMAEYYDTSKPNNIGYITQQAFLPNLMYRIYF